MIKNFEQFRNLWTKETSGIKIKEQTKNLVFIVMYPDNVEWDFGVEKQVQTTCLQTSGGVTGAGTGHNQILCYTSEIFDVLNDCNEYTHAMVVTAGMTFSMAASKSSIESFYDFAEGKSKYTLSSEVLSEILKWREGKNAFWCRGHIIAKPDKPAYLHHQHVEINLDVWRELGRPFIFERWKNYERSDKNYHDDYTPHWIRPEGRPTIFNFDDNARRIKSFSYNNMEARTKIQNRSWKILKDRKEGWRNKLDDDNYFKTTCDRLNSSFYVENTETLGAFGKTLPNEKFDVVFSPTAGYVTEVLVEKLNFDGEIVFYDYAQNNVTIKENIVEMNMSMEEIKKYSGYIDQPFNFTRNINQGSHGALLRKRAGSYGDFEYLRGLQKKMRDTYDIEYWLMDLIKPDYKKLKNKIEGKRVFFNASNIFSYHISHSVYTLDALVRSFNRLHKTLRSSEYYLFRGTRPTKQHLQYFSKK